MASILETAGAVAIEEVAAVIQTPMDGQPIFTRLVDTRPHRRVTLSWAPMTHAQKIALVRHYIENANAEFAYQFPRGGETIKAVYVAPPRFSRFSARACDGQAEIEELVASDT